MILVTGGAGYIGSHTLRALQQSGYEAVVLDNLYSGHRWAVPSDIPFYEGNVSDVSLLKKIISQYKIKSIIHFAAHLEVEESVRLPFKYYENNFLNSKVLIQTAIEEGVKNFVFSSTCAVYGNPQTTPVDENFPTQPLNPYGRSKLMTEWLLQDLATSSLPSLNFSILRYFNVAGSHVQGSLGQATPRATQLVKVCAEVALGMRSQLEVFGTDYPTPDGTCVRDYIHVDDLAEAHVLGLSYLEKGGSSEVFNLGYGRGYSVLEIIEAMKKQSGVDFKVVLSPRRAGDAISIYAEPAKIKNILGWEPRFADIDLICKTAFEWEKEYQKKLKARV
jgi:UDP-glucose 4-epimerase